MQHFNQTCEIFLLVFVSLWGGGGGGGGGGLAKDFYYSCIQKAKKATKNMSFKLDLAISKIDSPTMYKSVGIEFDKIF